MIDADTIQLARLRGACRPGLEWLESGVRTEDELVEHRPDWYLFGAALLDRGTPGRIELAARRDPLAALRFAPHKLELSTLLWCAEQHPLYALVFTFPRLPVGPARAALVECLTNPQR
jgi:hypothetical protein